MFKVSNDYDKFDGTYLVGEIDLVYADIELAFGSPMHGDDYKISGEWLFENEETGEVFSLYDWKSTNLYGGDRYPSVEKFRANLKPQTFNIGGKREYNVHTFKTLLKKQIEYAKRNEDKAEIALLGTATPYIKQS